MGYPPEEVVEFDSGNYELLELDLEKEHFARACRKNAKAEENSEEGEVEKACDAQVANIEACIAEEVVENECPTVGRDNPTPPIRLGFHKKPWAQIGNVISCPECSRSTVW